MTEHEIEEKVKKAFTSNVPNVLDNILSECNKQESRGIIMIKTKSRKRIIEWTVGIAAAMVALLLIGVLGTRLYQINYSVDTVVSLDVNPGIEIKVNQHEKVLAVNPLNEDGRIVIGDMTFKGNDIEVTVNALVGSMLRNGYLNDSSNSILVSVYGDDDTKANALQEKLLNEINNILQTDTFSGSVLGQIVTPNSELQELADSYSISLGKAQLIQQFISQEPQYSFEDLVGCTINELNLMSKMNGVTLDEIQSVGDVSDKAYIGIDRAKEIAFTHAGIVSESDVSKFEIEMDYEHDAMIYEVSFIYENYKYNYDINAKTGEIMEAKSNLVVEDKEKDKVPTVSEGNNIPTLDNTGSTENTNVNIGANKAKEIAFVHAGVILEGNVSKLEIETDYEHNVMIYEVSFIYENYKYNYDINASTGEIMEAKNNPIDDKQKDKVPTVSEENNIPTTENPDNTQNSTTNIGADRAKEIAFAHAGVTSQENVSKLEIETDYEHNVMIYEVSFIYENYKYNYDINASTEEIIEAKSNPISNKENNKEDSKENVENDKNKSSLDNNSTKNTDSVKKEDKKGQSTTMDYIGEENAKEIALQRAELSASDIAQYECDISIQKNIPVYKIKFVSNEYEYSCDVNALTGEISKYDSQPEHTKR